MRAVLDTCVLYPPILREILIGAATAGCYEPVWSPRIFDEWRGISKRDGATNEALIGGEIVRLGALFPNAMIVPEPPEMADLYLPDQDDIHVLAAARKASCEWIVTANLKDFPKQELAPFGVSPIHPDAFLRLLWLEWPDRIQSVVANVTQQAGQMAQGPVTTKALLKRARLPRLAKMIAQST